jgi:hypothetical protein
VKFIVTDQILSVRKIEGKGGHITNQQRNYFLDLEKVQITIRMEVQNTILIEFQMPDELVNLK